MRVAQSWREGTRRGPGDEWTWKENIFQPDATPKGLALRARVQTFCSRWWKRNSMPSQWDLGVWQEIEAEDGVREQLRAAAGDARPSIDEEVEEARSI